ncbi:MAG TPA: hypothetical protein VNU97_13660 [Rhizomicrobium sp.]|jgi:hypothetical protein|nr:hypothetical protein [Rhizomicrobium sp.]
MTLPASAHHRRLSRRTNGPSTTRILWLAAGLLVASTVPAFAYVDPGTGMLAIQGLIAAAVWIIAFVTHPVRTIKGWLARWRNRNDA